MYLSFLFLKGFQCSCKGVVIIKYMQLLLVMLG